jgi:ribosomal protein S18 acetylase RimI-like enzyme
MTTELTSSMRLRAPTDDEVETIAAWHPIPRDEVLGWWATPDVTPYAMIDADDHLVGYGELWLDHDEDEVELARLIVPAELRGRGLGRRLVDLLTVEAAATAMSTTFLRVQHDNDIAIRCYLSCGYVRLGPKESAVWNEGQRQEWVWMLLPSE